MEGKRSKSQVKKRVRERVIDASSLLCSSRETQTPSEEDSSKFFGRRTRSKSIEVYGRETESFFFIFHHHHLFFHLHTHMNPTYSFIYHEESVWVTLHIMREHMCHQQYSSQEEQVKNLVNGKSTQKPMMPEKLLLSKDDISSGVSNVYCFIS